MIATAKHAPERTDRQLYGSPADIMNRYGLKRTTTYGLIWSGELPSIKVGRSVLVPLAAVDEFLARQPSAAKSGSPRRTMGR